MVLIIFRILRGSLYRVDMKLPRKGIFSQKVKSMYVA